MTLFAAKAFVQHKTGWRNRLEGVQAMATPVIRPKKVEVQAILWHTSKMPMKEVGKEIRERDQWTTKPLPCPDGITRLMTMPVWYWDNLDWLCRHDHFEIDYVLSWILEHLNDTKEVDYEEQLSAMLQGSIFECMRRLFPFYNIGHPDNDNTRPPCSRVTLGALGEVASPGGRLGRRRPIRLYLGRGGRIGRLPPPV